jgi:hypothetical protein
LTSDLARHVWQHFEENTTVLPMHFIGLKMCRITCISSEDDIVDAQRCEEATFPGRSVGRFGTAAKA